MCANKIGKSTPLLRGVSKAKVVNEHNSANFKLSFQYFDSSQKYGSGFKDWQKDGLLAKACDVLQGYCCKPLREQVDGIKFAIYSGFPGFGFTKFKFPIHVPVDADWCRIHITGIAILVGHVVGDTFYLVFLDKTHQFYLTKLNRAKKYQ